MNYNLKQFAKLLERRLNCFSLIFKLLQYIRNSSFTLQGRQIQFDKYGDPPASLALVLWRPGQDPLFVKIATYESQPTVRFVLNEDLIPWFKNGTVSQIILKHLTAFI